VESSPSALGEDSEEKAFAKEEEGCFTPATTAHSVESSPSALGEDSEEKDSEPCSVATSSPRSPTPPAVLPTSKPVGTPRPQVEARAAAAIDLASITARVSKVLGGLWRSDARRDETYEICFEKPAKEAAIAWTCVRSESNMTKKFTVVYDNKQCFLWWGLGRTYFMDVSEVERQPRTARWYSANDQTKCRRPKFSWTRSAGEASTGSPTASAAAVTSSAASKPPLAAASSCTVAPAPFTSTSGQAACPSRRSPAILAARAARAADAAGTSTNAGAAEAHVAKDEAATVATQCVLAVARGA